MLAPCIQVFVFGIACVCLCTYSPCCSLVSLVFSAVCTHAYVIGMWQISRLIKGEEGTPVKLTVDQKDIELLRKKPGFLIGL